MEMNVKREQSACLLMVNQDDWVTRR